MQKNQCKILSTANVILATRSLMQKSFPKIYREKTSMINIMLYIYFREKELYDVTMTAAACYSDLPKTTAIRRIDHLADIGYIKKYKSCRDGRCVYISLTKEANIEIEEMLKRASSFIEKHYKVISGELYNQSQKYQDTPHNRQFT